jgi:hypothetical protein
VPTVEVTHATDGGLGDLAAIVDGERILLHVRHLANTGVSTSQLFLLDPTGTVVASTSVPVRAPGGRIELALMRTGSAALAVSTRDPGSMLREGIVPSDVYHWFRVEWPDDRIKVTRLPSWTHGQIWTEPPKLRSRDGTALTLCRDPRPEAVAGDLAFAFDGPIPPERLTTLKVERPIGYDACVIGHDRAVAVANLDFRDLVLFELTPGVVRAIGSMAAKGQRHGETGDGRLVNRSNQAGVFWRYYNKRIRRAERDGSLYLARLDPETLTPGQVVRLTADREVMSWHIMDGKRSAVLFWKNGLSRRSQSVRLLEFSRLDALPAQPVNFDQPYPEAAVETTAGRLAFSVEFTATPYRWTVRAFDF